MDDDFDDFDEDPQPRRRRRKSASSSGNNVLLWIGGGVAGIVLLSCIGCCGILAYVGNEGPATHVYAGSDIPEDFLTTMRNVGALEPGEQIQFMYSDAILDITDGFYFVSDRGVVVYVEAGTPPIIRVPFAEITSVTMNTNEDDWDDGLIMIVTQDGTPVSFPISSELEGDDDFYQAILAGAPHAEAEVFNMDTDAAE